LLAKILLHLARIFLFLPPSPDHTCAWEGVWGFIPLSRIRNTLARPCPDRFSDLKQHKNSIFVPDSALCGLLAAPDFWSCPRFGAALIYAPSGLFNLHAQCFSADI